MTTPRLAAIVLLLSAAAFAQANFEVQAPACGYAFPTACFGGGDPEGVWFNGVLTLDVPAFGATVGSANGLGMPCGGSRFLRVQCANPNFNVVPNGGPIPELPSFARVFIPIPPGSTSVSFCWDFYAAEYVNSAFNDAVAVDVMSGFCPGIVLLNLVYADMHSPGFATVTDSSPCGVITYIAGAGVHELLPAGPQSVVNATLPGGASFLRVTAANSLDNAATGQFVMDSVTFSNTCGTAFAAPFGPGSVMLINTPCPLHANASYFTAVTLAQGSFPNGWFFGLDMGLPELLNLFALGAPFTGVLNAVGSSTSPGFGPSASLSGLTLFAVTTVWYSGYTTFFAARPALAYTIP
jgi:hypothetical protein